MFAQVINRFPDLSDVPGLFTKISMRNLKYKSLRAKIDEEVEDL
jgi:hypothetical protein